jgi:uncharacterized membrane protein
MASEMAAWLLAIPLLGFATGLRTLTPIAVLCWYIHVGEISVDGTWAVWTGRLVTAMVFSVLAAGEWVGDKLPQTPNRIAPFPLIARLSFGGFCGAIAAAALRGPGLEGVLLGVLGAAIGAFVGFMARKSLVSTIGCPDWFIAVPEDLATLLLAIFATHIVANLS